MSQDLDQHTHVYGDMMGCFRSGSVRQKILFEFLHLALRLPKTGPTDLQDKQSDQPLEGSSSRPHKVLGGSCWADSTIPGRKLCL